MAGHQVPIRLLSVPEGLREKIRQKCFWSKVRDTEFVSGKQKIHKLRRVLPVKNLSRVVRNKTNIFLCYLSSQAQLYF